MIYKIKWINWLIIYYRRPIEYNLFSLSQHLCGKNKSLPWIGDRNEVNSREIGDSILHNDSLYARSFWIQCQQS